MFHLISNGESFLLISEAEKGEEGGGIGHDSGRPGEGGGGVVATGRDFI